jgi:hypothetical protein
MILANSHPRRYTSFDPRKHNRQSWAPANFGQLEQLTMVRIGFRMIGRCLSKRFAAGDDISDELFHSFGDWRKNSNTSFAVALNINFLDNSSSHWFISAGNPPPSLIRRHNKIESHDSTARMG